jgi:hypothetical protein
LSSTPNPDPKTPAAAAASSPTPEAAPDPQLAPQQFEKHKVKIKKVAQRACNNKDLKGKICAGHLKRWFYAEDTPERECGDLEKAWGPKAVVFRCENCRTLYLPNPEEQPSSTVAGRGEASVQGLTVPPK